MKSKVGSLKLINAVPANCSFSRYDMHSLQGNYSFPESNIHIYSSVLDPSSRMLCNYRDKISVEILEHWRLQSRNEYMKEIPCKYNYILKISSINVLRFKVGMMNGVPKCRKIRLQTMLMDFKSSSKRINQNSMKPRQNDWKNLIKTQNIICSST